jgi:hypothetical protein
MDFALLPSNWLQFSAFQGRPVIFAEVSSHSLEGAGYFRMRPPQVLTLMRIMTIGVRFCGLSAGSWLMNDGLGGPRTSIDSFKRGVAAPLSAAWFNARAGHGYNFTARPQL